MNVQSDGVKVRWWWIAMTLLSLAIFILALLSASLFVLALVNQSVIWEEARSDGVADAPMRLYWVFYPLLWLMISLLLLYVGKWTWQRSGYVAVWIVLAGALALRVVVVYGTQPVLSDDIWRYIHDGATLGNGVNPYASAPDDLSATQVPVPGAMDRMNNTGLVTIYQPTSQYVFAVLDRVWEWSPSAWQRLDPNHDKIFRFGFVLFDLVIVVLLLWQLRQMGRSAWWAAAYAWHPLTISEIAGSGHQDVIGIALLQLAMCLASRLIISAHNVDKPLAASRARWLAIGAGVAFGLALGVKPVVLPIALILAWTLRRRPGHIVSAAIATVLTGAAIYLPLVLMDGGLTGMVDTARVFIDKWAFNGSVHHLAVRWVFEKSTVDILSAGVLLAVIVVSLARSKGDAARSAGAFLFASLLVSSTVHPWYLLWALAFLPMYFNLPMWVFSLTIAASYAAHINPDGYRVPGSVAIYEYAPVYGLLVFAAVVWLWRLKVRTPG